MSHFWNRWIDRIPLTSHKKRKRKSTRRRLKAEPLDKRQLLAANIFHNEAMPEDVNADGTVTAFDALTVINQLNRQSRGGDFEDGNNQDTGRNQMTDVNNDGQASSVDALMVINRLNRDQREMNNQRDETQGEIDQPDDVSDEYSDVVLQWNDLFGELLGDSVANQNPGYASRSMAILNLAIYDTLTIAEGGADADTYYDYDIDFSSLSEGINSDVATSQAAYTVLSALYPDQQLTLDAFLESSISSYQADDNFADSLALGTEVGDEILAIRAGDGSDAVVDYTYSDEIGSFQADPLNPDVPVWGPAWGEVDTFSISSSDAFRPDTTPALTSEEYAASYNEVLELGAADSDTRTAEQTEIGLFWAYDRESLGTPLALYNDVLLTIAEQQGNSTQENAALFAQASVAMADAAIVAWDTKFTEEFWRPVTAIQEGDADGNPLTEGDADWTALGAPDGGEDEIGFTPQFPTYISGHATFGGALFGTLQEFYGTDDISFELTSEELSILLEDPDLQEAYGIDLEDATRSFSSFSEAMAENGRSRVYLGIHFDFDDLVGQSVGQAVASSVAADFAAIAEDSSETDDDTNSNGEDKLEPRFQIPQQDERTRRTDRLAAVDSAFADGIL